jgi:LAGLIDADG DNA endonuclease family/Cytochrome C oxidase subunit II, transmembrane domain
MQSFISIFNIILNDVAEPWQLGFQDSAAPGFTGLVTLHNTIGFYLIVISISVFWVLFSLIYYYSSNKNLIAHKYLTHGTVLELVWTITPALILICIAFPSFRLLYLMDEVISPTLTIKVVGLFPVLVLTLFLNKGRVSTYGGLKLYILNKMKDTIFKGKKNNMYYQTILNKITLTLKLIKFSSKVRLPSSNPLKIKNSLFFPYRQGFFQNIYLPVFGKGEGRKYYHISNIRAVNRIGPHNEDVLSVIIGSLLGDAYANKRSGEGVRLCYRQSVKHKEYLFWLYTFFYNRGYTSNLQPRQYTRTIKIKEGKIYYGYEFNTFTFRSFSWIHDMFYKNGRKVIPTNIYEYLTPLALAVWIMDDGGWTNYGIRIATNSFNLKEVEILQGVLISKYNLDTTIQSIYIKDQYSIYIKKQSVNNLRNIVGLYIHFSM